MPTHLPILTIRFEHPSNMATQSQVLPTSDLRSSAKEVQREVEHKTKWARGGCRAPGKACAHGALEADICHDHPILK